MTLRIAQNWLISTEQARAVDVLSGEVVLLSAPQCQRLNSIAFGACEADPIGRELVDLGIAEPESVAHLVREAWEDAVRDFLGSHGALCVMPTEKCNLRCQYCYESFLKGGMKPAVQASVSRYLERTMPSFANYSLAWFGGEPLLQPDVIHSISRTYRELQARHGVRGSIAMTTNGTLLTPSRVKQLSDINIDLFHVSVDGPRHLHDGQRRSLSGRSTYDLILDNLENALEATGCQVAFRVNLRTDNPENGHLVAAWLRDEIQPRFQRFKRRLRIHIVSVWDATTSEVDGICITEQSRFHTWFDVQRRLMELQECRDIAHYLAQRVSGLGSLACYAGKPNHYIVGSDGAIYKCTVAFDRPDNQLGRIEADGELSIDPRREAKWTASNSLTDSSCGGCPLATSCMGIHCPLTRMLTNQPPCPTEKRWIQSFFPTFPSQGVLKGDFDEHST